MSCRTITPAEAEALLASGARLIDVREPDEHARTRIAGAANLPLGRIGSVEGEAPVIWHCRSGMRTSANAARLAAASEAESYLLAGGLEGWRKAGLPVVTERRPIEVMRQVQIVAGSLIVLSVLLGLLVAPPFLALAAFVGGGLVFAGTTGWCGMARLLALMPWNRMPVAS